jgi:hypothetical protein
MRLATLFVALIYAVFGANPAMIFAYVIIVVLFSDWSSWTVATFMLLMITLLKVIWGVVDERNK